MSQRFALALIVIAELLGTSLWFCGAVAAPDLASSWSLSTSERGWLLSATQLGFITGTLAVSLSGIADRFQASRIFAVSAFVGAVVNGLLVACDSLMPALATRFVVGLCLAGIYPLGMKLIIGWAPGLVGVALSWLVGALVLGTSLPHLLRGLGTNVHWSYAVLTASLIAIMAGLIVGCLGDGPSSRSGAPIGWANVRVAFQQPGFRASALGYFGHMWELYAFWAMVPLLVSQIWLGASSAEISLATFAIIACGGVGCVVGGWASRSIGPARVAAISLGVSMTMALLSIFLPYMPLGLGMALLLVWGITVVSDSPQFSALSAAHAPPTAVGSGLAVQNAIGFAITLVSIDLMSRLGTEATVLLAIGPFLGLLAMRPLLKHSLINRRPKT